MDTVDFNLNKNRNSYSFVFIDSVQSFSEKKTLIFQENEKYFYISINILYYYMNVNLIDYTRLQTD